MNKYTYITLRDRPQLRDRAAEWFHCKWGVPQEAYLECMEDYLNNETEYGWYLCLDGDRIIGGLGVIENDFHIQIIAHIEALVKPVLQKKNSN